MDTFTIQKSDILKLSDINSDVCLELQRLFPDVFGIKTKWILIKSHGLFEHTTLIRLRDYIKISENMIFEASEVYGYRAMSSSYSWNVISDSEAEEFINNLK